eukprot:IDg9860t1
MTSRRARVASPPSPLLVPYSAAYHRIPSSRPFLTGAIRIGRRKALCMGLIEFARLGWTAATSRRAPLTVLYIAGESAINASQFRKAVLAIDLAALLRILKVKDIKNEVKEKSFAVSYIYDIYLRIARVSVFNCIDNGAPLHRPHDRTHSPTATHFAGAHGHGALGALSRTPPLLPQYSDRLAATCFIETRGRGA